MRYYVDDGEGDAVTITPPLLHCVLASKIVKLEGNIMSKLLNGVEKSIDRRDYQLTYTIGTGTAKIKQSIDGGAFQDVTGTALAVSGALIVTLATSEIKSVLTGDAQLSISRV